MSKGNKHQAVVKKKSGSEELFIPEKLCNSIIAVGAPDNLAYQVCDLVEESIGSGISTDDIFVITRDYLKERDPKIAGLYALDRALSALGPSGFLFEQYVAALFKTLDYQVSTNVFAQGEGITHEVDVWCEKGNIVLVVEAKYRNDFRTKTHIDQVMYADAQIEDIRRRAKKDHDPREYYMWMVTNTRFSESALEYVRHRDIQLMGWDYPKFINLKKIVSDKKLYPVTVLPSITRSVLHALAAEGIVLVRSLAGYTSEMLEKEYAVAPDLAIKLEGEIQDLIS